MSRGSSAPIALDIKDFIYMEISKGKTKSEIKDQVASKFGDDVLFSPPRNLSTLLLYIFPLILVFLALLANNAKNTKINGKMYSNKVDKFRGGENKTSSPNLLAT